MTISVAGAEETRRPEAEPESALGEILRTFEPPIAESLAELATDTRTRYRWLCESRCDDPYALALEITETLSAHSFRPSAPFRYRLYMALLILWALAMPVIYVALIALVAVGTCVFVNFALLSGQPIRGKGPLIVALLALGGVFTCVLMLRPLFSRLPGKEPEPGIPRDEAPLLFLLIDQLCACLGVVPPKQVYFDLSCNAAAGSGWSWRAAWRADSTLMLGLPLVAGLTIQELAGVIAHELGHFNQSLASRLGFVAYRIQLWFARVVFEPSRIDALLQQHSSGWFGHWMWVIQAPIYFVRKTLKLLMRATELALRALARQREFDADQSECFFVGSERFRTTFARIVTLEAGTGQMDDLLNHWRLNEIVCDDYPKLVVALADRLKPEAKRIVAEAFESRKWSWFDTHPPTDERIERALNAGHSGVLKLRAPAAMLFDDFGATCRAITAEKWAEVELKGVPLPTTAIVEEIDRWDELDEAGRHFYRFGDEQFQPKGLATARRFRGTTSERVAHLRALRAKLAPAEKEFRDWAKRRLAAEGEIARLRVFASLLRDTAIEQIDGDMRGPIRSTTQIEHWLTAEWRKRAEADAMANRLAELDGEHVRTALDLLTDSAVRGRIRNGARLLRRAKELLPLAARMEQQLPAITNVWRRMLWLRSHQRYVELDTLQKLEAGVSKDAVIKLYEGFVAGMKEEAEQLCSAQAKAREALGNDPYPFTHGRSGTTIGSFALPNLPQTGSPTEVAEAAWNFAVAANYAHVQLCNELAWIAEQAESAVGLARLAPIALPEPEEAPTDSTPWYSRKISERMVGFCCVVLGMAFVLAGCLMFFFDWTLAVVLLSGGGVLLIGGTLALA